MVFFVLVVTKRSIKMVGLILELYYRDSYTHGSRYDGHSHKEVSKSYNDIIVINKR